MSLGHCVVLSPAQQAWHSLLTPPLANVGAHPAPTCTTWAGGQCFGRFALPCALPALSAACHVPSIAPPVRAQPVVPISGVIHIGVQCPPSPCPAPPSHTRIRTWAFPQMRPTSLPLGASLLSCPDSACMTRGKSGLCTGPLLSWASRRHSKLVLPRCHFPRKAAWGPTQAGTRTPAARSARPYKTELFVKLPAPVVCPIGAVCP